MLAAESVTVTLSRAHRVILVAACMTVTLAGWLWLLPAQAHSLPELLLTPHCAAATRTSFSSTLLMWLAMSMAMMAPTTLNWLFAYAALVKPSEVFRSIAAFLTGYLLVWFGFSAIAALLQMALQQFGLLNHQGKLPTTVAALVLILSGVVYFTPISRACLKHCRNPLTYFVTRWKGAPGGGFRFGMVHGAYCVGCCWTLMLTGFAMGVMNLVWMAVLTVMMCMEKLLPRGEWIGRLFAAGLTVWGLMLVV